MWLTALEPDWISPPGRFGVGVAFLCPACGTHHVFVFFSNPVDLDPQEENDGTVKLYTRTSYSASGLGDLSLLEPLELDHWRGMLRDGFLMQN